MGYRATPRVTVKQDGTQKGNQRAINFKATLPLVLTINEDEDNSNTDITFGSGLGGATGCRLIAGATAYVGFDSCKEPHTNYFLADGIEDNAQVQLAVDYVASLGGGRVEMERGDWSFIGPVTVSTQGTTIMGSGYDTYITQPNNTNLARFFLFTANDCRIKYMFIDGNTDNNTTSYGVEADGVTDFGAFYVKCRYMPDNGFYVHSNSIRVRIHRCVARDGGGNGLEFKSSTDSFITYNTLTGNGENGLFLDTTVGVIVVGNQCLVNGLRGINAYESTLCTIDDNVCNNSGRSGIRIGGPSVAYNKNNVVTANICYVNSQSVANTYHGIYLDGEEVQKNVISNNNVKGSDHMYGIAENDATDNIITDNELRGQSTGSLYIGSNTYIRGNKVDGTSTIHADADVPDLWLPAPVPDYWHGKYYSQTLTDGAETNVGFLRHIPNDFQQLISMDVIVIPGGTGNFRRLVETQFGKMGSEVYTMRTG